MGIQYTPGATRFEVIRVFRVAASRHLPVFTHVRSFGLLEPGSSIEAISEVIGAAAISGASLHIVHINSSCNSVGLECVSLVAGARARGLDITTEERMPMSWCSTQRSLPIARPTPRRGSPARE